MASRWNNICRKYWRLYYNGITTREKIEVEAAHQIPMCTPHPGAPARSIIVRLHTMEIKNKISKMVEQKRSTLQYQGHEIQIFKDQMRRVQSLRLHFWDFKKRLREKAISFSMVREATLRVVYKYKVMFFENSKKRSPL